MNRRTRAASRQPQGVLLGGDRPELNEAGFSPFPPAGQARFPCWHTNPPVVCKSCTAPGRGARGETLAGTFKPLTRCATRTSPASENGRPVHPSTRRPLPPLSERCAGRWTSQVDGGCWIAVCHGRPTAPQGTRPLPAVRCPPASPGNSARLVGQPANQGPAHHHPREEALGARQFHTATRWFRIYGERRASAPIPRTSEILTVTTTLLWSVPAPPL